MSPVTLSVKEVRALLSHLKKAGVKSFEGLNVKVDFADKTDVEQIQTVRQTPASAKKAENIEQLSFLDESADVSEDLISHALIENPAEYERLIREGELEDARGETSQDRGLESAV